MELRRFVWSWNMVSDPYGLNGKVQPLSLLLELCTWHGARTLFRDIFADIDPDLGAQVEFGAFQKIGVH
ncbi:hypothetical protein ZIOFF_035088 [Zingiber officinale]|uniref:Uncharacterized protein n=1 Tax=Zingiber officinale TaxID=94328 RepID=A0A8J5G8C4_ZINOF|nr:hypothetical protein ZIOFF_035088 [Zingiber officinale]